MPTLARLLMLGSHSFAMLLGGRHVPLTGNLLLLTEFPLSSGRNKSTWEPLSASHPMWWSRLEHLHRKDGKYSP